MAGQKRNFLKKVAKWLFSVLTLQALWRKPKNPGNVQQITNSYVSGNVPQTTTGYVSAGNVLQITNGYESDRPDPFKTAKNYVTNMKKEVDPCVDFYEYACGNFPTANPIPQWYNAVAATDTRVHEINQKILVYLESGTVTGPPIFQKIRTFYSGCMNEVAIQQKGMETIYGELQMLELPTMPPFGTSIKGDYIKILAKIHRNNPLAEFLFDVSVQVDPVNMQVNRIFFGNTPATSHASMNVETEGLYSFAKFSNVFNARTAPDERRYQAIRNALKTYIFKVVQFMINSQANTGKTSTSSSQFIPNIVEKVTNFLLELEKTRQLGKYNRVEKIHRTTVSRMQDTVNMMDNIGRVGITWNKYFQSLFSSGLQDVKSMSTLFNTQDPIVLIQNLEQFKEVLTLFHKTKKEVFVPAMWFAVVQSLASVGPKILQDYREEYLRAVYQVDPTPRRLTCLNLVRTNFGYFVGHILAKDRRSEKEQLKVIEMVDNVKYSLLEAIQKAQWMDPVTKAGAKTKLNSISPYVSVWETLKDPDKLQQFYGNTLEIGPTFQLTYMNMLRKRRSENLQTLFTKNDLQRKPYPNSASIYPRYYPSFVHLTVPIGALGYLFYDLGLEAFNYGALSVLITRELWHALDASGQNFDQHGNRWPWWSSSTHQEYEKLESVLRQFYGAIKFQELQVNVDGVHTAIENVADIVGFEVGYKAYQRHIQRHDPEKDLNAFLDFSHDKWFTLAFANMHCIHASLEYIYGQITEDENPPHSVRVNGVTRNSKEFSRIWNCPSKPAITIL